MLTLAQRWWTLLRPDRAKSAMAMACMALVAAATASLAWLAGPATDLLLGDTSDGPLTVDALWLTGLGLLVLRGAASWAQGLLVSDVQQSLALRLRTEAMARLVRLSRVDPEEQSGQIASRIATDVDRIEGMVTVGIAPVFSGALVIGGLFLLALEKSTALPLVMLLVLPLVAVAASQITKPIRERFRAAYETRGRLTAAVVETVSRLEILRVFRAEAWRARELTHLAEELRDNNLRAHKTAIAVSPVIATITATALAGMVYWAHGQVEDGSMPLSTFSTLLTVAVLMFRPVQTLGRGIAQAAGALAALDHYDEFMALPVIEPAPEGTSIGRSLGLRNVRLVLGDVEILKDLSLRLEPGRSVALVGPNGAGKTSILRVLTGALPISGGAVEVDGTPDPTLARVRGMVAWVPQEPLLFAGPVANNVALDTEVDRARLDEALRLSGAASWATPEMILADGGLGRSRGERQMLSIARALYADAPYLLLDEPTASLDRQASALLVETLGTLTAKRTLLVVTHREDIAEQMDTTYEIRDGRVVSRRDERPGVRGLSA